MDNLARLKNILEIILGIAIKVIGWLVRIYQKVWLWLHTRVPILGALVRRHIKNPSTVFIDAAVLILFVYIGFGIVGFIQIFPKKADNRSSLYRFCRR
jgi:hypothetical protein